MTTIFEGLYGNEVTVRTDSKKNLKKALQEVFGDNADAYMELAINTFTGFYELGLAPKYAMEVYNILMSY